MAGAPVAEFALRISATDDASDVVAQVNAKLDAFAAKGVASTKRAQDQITAIIARGDPAKAAQLAAQRELETVQRLARQKPVLAQQAADAELAIRKRLAAELARIDQSTVASTAAASTTLQQRAKGAAETVSKIAGLANVAGTALGGMGGAAGQAATSIVGAFGAGGPVAIALAATVATIGMIAVKWNGIQQRLEQARADLAATRAAAAAGGAASLEEAEAQLGAMTATPGSASRARAERELEFARKWESDAAAANARATDASARLREAEARANALAADTRDRPGAMAAASAIGEEIERLTRETTAAKQEAEQLALAAAEYRRSAGAWENLASAERSRAKAKSKARGGGGAAAAVAAAAEERDTRGAQLALMELPGGQAAGEAEQRAGALTPAEIEARYREQFAAEERARRQAISDQAAAAALQEQQRIIGIMGDVTAYTTAGAGAMRAFIDGMEAERPADRVKGILTSVLTVAGAIVGGVIAGPAGIMAGAGLGGALAGAATSFERGGPALAVGRRGLATMPGGNDGIPAVLHPGEFTFSAPAVRAMGGIGAATQAHEALRDGRSMRGGGGPTTINVVALDPMTAVGVLQQSVEPAQTQRLAARQGSLYRAELQRAARGIDSGV